ncbi:helix-turn-helix transcriptional regulator [Pseudomonas aeruginosa]
MTRACGLGERHFSKAFSEEIGSAPHKWLQVLRIEHSKSLLVAGKMELSEVATGCGFASQRHFCRAFKDAVGVSARTLAR